MLQNFEFFNTTLTGRKFGFSDSENTRLSHFFEFYYSIN